jgi:hypothetical protein
MKDMNLKEIEIAVSQCFDSLDLKDKTEVEHRLLMRNLFETDFDITIDGDQMDAMINYKETVVVFSDALDRG